jgi:ribosomal protein L7/L12
MTDQTVVSEAALQAALNEIGCHGPERILRGMAQAEPNLGPFIRHTAVQVAGKLALTGAPPEVVQGVHEDLLSACALTYLAFRKGSFEIWRDTALGERLKDLELEPAAANSTAVEPCSAGGMAGPAEELGVVLVATAPGRKRDVIRTLCRLTGQAYRQARAMLDRVPVVVLRGITPDDASNIKATLEQAGAHVVVRPIPLNDDPSSAK